MELANPRKDASAPAPSSRPQEPAKAIKVYIYIYIIFNKINYHFFLCGRLEISRAMYFLSKLYEFVLTNLSVALCVTLNVVAA